MLVKRLLVVSMACAMLLFGTISPARADVNYNYLDADGVLKSHSIPFGHVIGGDWDTASTTLTGWYAVTGTLTVNHTLVVSGEAHLVLTDGASLTVNGGGDTPGIRVASGDSLTIYGQSDGSAMGRLSAKGGGGSAGIGGGINQSCGAVTIMGGSVTAAVVINGSAGIGGGLFGTSGDRPSRRGRPPWCYATGAASACPAQDFAGPLRSAPRARKPDSAVGVAF